MAIGNTTQFSDRGVLREVYEPMFESAVFRNNHLLGLTLNGKPMIPEIPFSGEKYRWPINSAGNTSTEVFTEGAGAPTPVAQSYKSAEQAATYFWAWTRVTGHVRDAVRNGAATGGANPLDNEFIAGFEDLRDLVNTSLMQSSYGLELAVDDASTYAGIAQGSYTWFAAKVTNHNGALTRAGLLNIHEASRNADYGGNTSVVLCAHNQLTNYIALTGEPNVQNSSVRVELGLVGGGAMDLAPRYDALSFMGAPLVGLPDFTSTIFMGMDLRNVANGPNLGRFTARPFDIRGPQMVGDDDVYEMSTATGLVLHSPKLCWKLEGVTA